MKPCAPARLPMMSVGKKLNEYPRLMVLHWFAGKSVVLFDTLAPLICIELGEFVEFTNPVVWERITLDV